MIPSLECLQGSRHFLAVKRISGLEHLKVCHNWKKMSLLVMNIEFRGTEFRRVSGLQSLLQEVDLILESDRLGLGGWVGRLHSLGVGQGVMCEPGR